MEGCGYRSLTGWINISSREVEQSLVLVESGGSEWFSLFCQASACDKVQYSIFLAMEKECSVWVPVRDPAAIAWPLSKIGAADPCLAFLSSKTPTPDLNLPLSVIQAHTQHLYFIHIPTASDDLCLSGFEEVIFLF